MQRDMAAAVEREKTSLGSVVLAEEKRRARVAAGEESGPTNIEPAREREHISMMALAVIGGIALTTGAIAAVAIALLREAEPPRGEPVPLVHTVVPVDGSVSPVTLGGLTTLSIRSRLREAVETADVPINSLSAIPLVDRGQLVPEERGAIAVELTADEFLRRVAPEAPAALRRSLEPTFTFGVHYFGRNTAFLAFGVSSFEQAFAEMLAWERTLEIDLGPVFRQSGAPSSLSPQEQENQGGADAVAATTTLAGAATSTTMEAPPRRTTSSRSRRFLDEVIANHDVRVLRDERGEPFLLYAFPNRSTLFFAASIPTLEELFRRLTTLKRE
jgi:hypothetical protein